MLEKYVEEGTNWIESQVGKWEVENGFDGGDGIDDDEVEEEGEMEREKVMRSGKTFSRIAGVGSYARLGGENGGGIEHRNLGVRGV